MNSSKKKFFLIDKCNLLAFFAMEVSHNKSLPTFFSKRLLRREHCVAELFSTNSNSCIELWGHRITVQDMPRGLCALPGGSHGEARDGMQHGHEPASLQDLISQYDS